MKKEATKPFKIRAHHIICLLLYRGVGYDEAFTRNMDAKSAFLKENEGTPIHIAENDDLICAKCPNFTGICADEEKVSQLDRAWSKKLGISANDTVIYSEINALACEKLAEADTFEKICGRCEWFTLCIDIIKKEKLTEK